jgi:hypothetical protein
MFGIFVTAPNTHLLNKLRSTTTDAERKQICEQHGCIFDSATASGQVRVFPTRVYLDDERSPPRHWYIVQHVQEMINLLVQYEDFIDEISLDHDLGAFGDSETGYDVLLWIEQEVATNKNYRPPKIQIHTANPSAAIKMKLAAASIARRTNKSNE